MTTTGAVRPSTTSSTSMTTTSAVRPSTTSSTSMTTTGAVRPSTTSSTSMTTTGAVRPSTTSSTSMTTTGAVRPSTTSSTSMTTTGAVRPSTTSSTSMTTTGAAMEDDEMEEAPLDLGPPEIIMNLTEVTTEDLVEQDVAVERNRERNKEEQCHTRRHRRYQTPDPLNSFQQRLLQAVERDAAQPDAHRKEDEETLFAMSLVPTLKRLPQQRQAAVKVKMYQLLFQAEFNETHTPLHTSDLQCPALSLFMAMSEVPLLRLGFMSSPCIGLQLCQKYMLLLFSYRLHATHKKTCFFYTHAHTPLSIVLYLF
ncbi:uncharacterized protein ACWYII_032690 isoform 3-T4 [Salvelinus alpinus]